MNKNSDTKTEHQVDGRKAFNIVKSYSDLGYHRTGTKTDIATIDWLAGMLRNAGAEVTCPHFSYRHYDAAVTVTINDHSIEAMALHYAYTGTTTISHPAFGEVNGHDAEDDISNTVITAITNAKKYDRDGLILTTNSPDETLCGINRQCWDVLDFPVILIGRKDRQRVRENPAQITISATAQDRTARNIVAQFRSSKNTDQLLMLTTPVSGWFNCAGERGCGIAISLILAEKLSAHCPVDLLLASGHELGFAGGYHLARTYDRTPCAIVHLGSSIANIGADMISVCTAPPAQFSQINKVLNTLEIRPARPRDVLNPDGWVGESMCWAPKNRPMLSIAGISPHFHTPLDLAESVTTPDLLETAIEQTFQATRVLIEK